VVSKKVLLNAETLACIINFLCSLCFVSAANAILLSRRPFKLFQVRFYGDVLVLVCVVVLVTVITVLSYSYVPKVSFEI
jgi:hypothetical protein